MRQIGKLIILFIFGFSIAAHAADYRSFTDKEGRVIKAKIIKVDKGFKKVTLERENKKKATVPISIFSEADQEYINAWSPFKKAEVVTPETSEPEPKTKQTIHSKAEVKEIGEKYVLFCQQTKYSSPERFFHKSAADYIANNSEAVRVAWLNNYMAKSLMHVEEVKLGQCGAGYFQVQIHFKAIDYVGNGEKTKRGPLPVWALLAPDGKIKYETVVHPHPVEELTFLLLKFCSSGHAVKPVRLRDSDEDAGRRFSSLLQDCGGPPFSFEDDIVIVHDFKKREKRALKKVVEWLIENGASMDVSEPKVYYPEDAFEVLKKILEKIERKVS